MHLHLVHDMLNQDMTTTRCLTSSKHQILLIWGDPCLGRFLLRELSLLGGNQEQAGCFAIVHPFSTVIHVFQGQHGSEASDDEGIDSDNDQVKHYSTDDDIDLNEDRTGDTLKPPNRSRKHLVIKELPAGNCCDSALPDASVGQGKFGTNLGFFVLNSVVFCSSFPSASGLVHFVLGN